MSLQLNHQKLDIYTFSKASVFECYKLSRNLPADEKFGMISQIRRAALCVHLNIAEGVSGKSGAERKWYDEISGSSIAEIDASPDIASDLGHLVNYYNTVLAGTVIRKLKILCGPIDSKSSH